MIINGQSVPLDGRTQLMRVVQQSPSEDGAEPADPPADFLKQGGQEPVKWRPGEVLCNIHIAGNSIDQSSFFELTNYRGSG